MLALILWAVFTCLIHWIIGWSWLWSILSGMAAVFITGIFLAAISGESSSSSMSSTYSSLGTSHHDIFHSGSPEKSCSSPISSNRDRW
jgi:hypothetical protein